MRRKTVPGPWIALHIPDIGWRSTTMTAVPHIGETVRFRAVPYRVSGVTYDTVEINGDIHHRSVFVKLEEA